MGHRKYNDAYFRYLDAYNEAILEFISNESAIYKKKQPKTQSDWFFISFYETASKMMNNGCDLSDKQREIIEREMNKRNTPIPRIEQFNLTFRLFFKLDYNGYSFADHADLGDFFYLLAKSNEINAEYEEKFNNNLHIEFFHKK